MFYYNYSAIYIYKNTCVLQSDSFRPRVVKRGIDDFAEVADGNYFFNYRVNYLLSLFYDFVEVADSNYFFSSRRHRR